MSEVDSSKVSADFAWCVYIHRRPDGSAFYIGKGRPHRARDFSPSRRTAWHKNVVAKYGRENIGVQILPCATESEAFALERAHIAAARTLGAKLANLTDGGEGASGHVPTAKQLAGLAKGRVKGKQGKSGPRPALEAWKQTPEGRAHALRLAKIGSEVLHRERTLTCCECGCEFTTHSAKAKCCGRTCEQRYRRAGKNK